MRTKSWIIGTMLAVLLWLCFTALLMWASERHAKADVFTPNPRTSMLRVDTDEWFNMPPAAVLLVNGQDPIDDPEIGNPDHLDRECGNQKNVPAGQVKCKCAEHWECGEEHAPTHCRSWCFPKNCHCVQHSCG